MTIFFGYLGVVLGQAVTTFLWASALLLGSGPIILRQAGYPGFAERWLSLLQKLPFGRGLVVVVAFGAFGWSNFSAYRGVQETLIEIEQRAEGPILRTLDEQSERNPDGTYTIQRLIRVESQFAPNLLHLEAIGDGVIDLNIVSEGRNTSFLIKPAQPNSISIQFPNGAYTVVVRSKTPKVLIDHRFE